jgi:hypothetical protein
MKKSGIYMWLNVNNNKCYVGSSKNMIRRKSDHLKSLKNNNHHNGHLQKSFNKYGESSFTFIILELCNEEDLLTRELKWIELKKSTDRNFGYNMSLPKPSDVVKMSDALLEKKRRNTYKQHNIQIPYEEWKTANIEEAVRKKEKPKKKKRPIIQIDVKTGEFVEEYKTIVDCAKTLNYSENQLKRLGYLLRGAGRFKDRKSYLGYIFIYAEDYDKSFDYRNYKCRTVRERISENKKPGNQRPRVQLEPRSLAVRSKSRNSNTVNLK